MARNFGNVEQAVRQGQKARISLVGLSGSGKTMSALELANIITGGGKVIVIDTENKSANLYADQFGSWNFDIYNWEPPFNPRELTLAIKEFEQEYDAIVIDSFSAFWNGKGGLLEIVENAKSGRDSTSGWKVATPIQEEVIQTILRADCHMFVNVRAKAGVEIERNEKGKVSVRKVPMQVVQRDNLIYEMTISANIDVDSHTLSIEKSRFSEIADQTFMVGQERKELGAKIRDWLDSAEAEAAEDAMIEAVESGLDSNREETPKAANKNDVSDGPVSEDEADAIIAMFGAFEGDAEALGELKNRFAAEMGVSHPNQLMKSQYEQATKFLENLLVSA